MAISEECCLCSGHDGNLSVKDWCEMDGVDVDRLCGYVDLETEDILCYDCYHTVRDEYESNHEPSFQGNYHGEDDPEGTFLNESEEEEGGYVIYERRLGSSRSIPGGWVDDYNELSSELSDAVVFETYDDAVEMVDAIEEYVANFNDGDGIKAIIQKIVRGNKVRDVESFRITNVNGEVVWD